MTTTHLSTNQALDFILTALDKIGWRDDGETATRIVAELGSVPLSLARARRSISGRFLALNATTREKAAVTLHHALREVRITRPLEAVLLQIDEIDSFSRAATVSPTSVIEASSPLPLPEATVKRFIALVLGEPYIGKDWGGELTDQFTTRVILGGVRVAAAFLLKGSGTPGRLTPKKLGKNGDQIRRLSKVQAELYVVQHVDAIDESVRDELADMVRSKRHQGQDAVGSLWDGSDCARLFLSHGLINERGDPIR